MSCPICGQKQNTQSVCSRCISLRPIYNQLRSWAIFNIEIRNAIHKLKYRKDTSLGEILSRHLIHIVNDLHWSVDIVIPVPLSNDRLKERGYNQAALIALPLSLGLGLKYHPKALKRIRETESQVGLSIIQRHDNVFGAFAADCRIVPGKNILIVDDA
jgi:ComF family protein